MANYNLVSTATFTPFTDEEILRPFVLYQQAYKEDEQRANELADKFGKYAYLKDLDESNPARQLYEGYVNDFDAWARDFQQNGLSQGNRRTGSAMRRRYASEIGQLDEADKELQKELDLRREMNAKDPTMLYNTDNLSISDFLGRRKPNLYSISGNELYKSGVQAGQSASSRMYQNTQISDLNKYYQETIQRVGPDPRLLEQWRSDLESIPAFNEALDDILKAQGVNDNLSGINYERARQNVINGIMDGAVYKEARNTVPNQGVLTAAQAAQDARAREATNLNATLHGAIRQKDGSYRYDYWSDPSHINDKWMYTFKDGKVTGYSQEYLDAYQKMHPKGRTTVTNEDGTTTEVDTDKVKLKKGQAVSSSGNSKATSIPNGAEEVTYDEAVEATKGKIREFHPGYENNYRWWKSGNKIYPEPIGNEVDAVNPTPTTPTAPVTPTKPAANSTGKDDQH